MKGELSNLEIHGINTTEIGQNYRDIKPSKEMSTKELNDAVSAEFCKEVRGTELTGNQKEYKDDNGEKYRIGDSLLPNKVFEVNGYKYKTDDKGRVISAEGKLQVKNHEGRNDMDARSVIDKGDMRKTDDRGHLIADRFNGSGGLENVVAMDSNLNQHGDYKKMENTLADAKQDGANVQLKVEPVYKGDSTRPSEFRVSYSIDGEKTVTVFKNESGVKS